MKEYTQEQLDSGKEVYESLLDTYFHHNAFYVNFPVLSILAGMLVLFVFNRCLDSLILGVYHTLT